MNGPCGGVKDGRCELGDRDCAWVQIYDRLEAQGRGDEFDEIGDAEGQLGQARCAASGTSHAEAGRLAMSLEDALDSRRVRRHLRGRPAQGHRHLAR